MTPVPESVEEAVKRVTAWLNDPVTGAYPIASPMRTILAALAQGPKEGDTITEGLTDCGEGEPFTPGSVGEDASMAAYAVLRSCDLISAGDHRVPDRIGQTVAAFLKDRAVPNPQEAEGFVLVPRVWTGPIMSAAHNRAREVSSSKSDDAVGALAWNAYQIFDAVVKAASPPAPVSGWRDMADAPRGNYADRTVWPTPILARFKSPIPRDGRPDLEPWAGRYVVIHHTGIAPDGFDIGWTISAPVGHGGFPDDWFVGWQPVEGRVPTPQGEGRGE